jgi:YD repeat-containing protein
MKFTKGKTILFVLLSGLVSMVVNGQNPYMPNVVPPSPNASALTKFSDVPVSNYTGAAEVTIPIYTINARGISLPITLSYHTGGIHLKEEASWAGLGWALSVGGSISRTIMDKDDYDGNKYFNSVVPEINGTMQSHQDWTCGNPYFYDFFCNYLVYTDQGTKDFTSAFTSSNPLYDFEPDIYNYNFLGRSGKFIISRNKKVVLQKQDNLNIQFDPTGLWFTITDDQGNRFYFNDREIVQNNNGLPSSGSTSAWYLSKIITQLSDTVKFNYLVDSTWTTVNGDINQSYRDGCSQNEGLFSSQNPPTLYMNVTLQNIDYQGGQVQFSFDNNRVDLTNGKKLNSVKIYSKIGNTLTYVKENQFFYSYFNSGYSGTANEFQRLRLDSVKEVSGTSSLPPYSFQYFSPLSGSVPNTGKHAFSVDHWGYFNGVANSMLVPSFEGVTNDFNGQYITLAGAVRDPDSASMKIFSLYQVGYPTGGRTVFQFEPNYYDDQKSINGQPELPQTLLIDTTITVVMNTRGTTTGTINMSNIFPIGLANNAQVTVTFRTTTNNGCSVYRNTSGKIYFSIGGNTIDISNTNLTCDPNTPVCISPSTPLNIFSSNDYPVWTAYIDPSVGSDFVEIRATVHWQELRSIHYKNPTVMCSGLRVKTITDYNESNQVTKIRTWDYTYQQDRDNDGVPETYSYGRLMSYPSFIRYERVIVYPNGPGNGAANCISLSRSASSNTSLNSVISGNIVGYDQVTEYTIDYNSGVSNGKTVYTYFNSPDTLYPYCGFRLPGVLNMGNNLNGNLTSKTVYANTGNNNYKKASATYYNYHTTNRLAYYSMKYAYEAPLINSSASTFCGSTGGPVPNEFFSCFYPSIKSERVLMDSVTEISYDQFDTTHLAKLITYNYYDNPVHYQLTRSHIADSKGNTKASLIKYPQDYIPSGNTVTNNTILDSMINRNLVSSVIEKQDSIYYQGSSGGFVTGADLSIYKILPVNNSIGIDRKFKLSTSAPINNFSPFSISGNTTSQDSRYRQMIQFNSYDAVNNIREYTAIDQLPVSFIWDYNRVYPIVKATNSDSASVAYTSFEADGSGNWSIGSTLRNTGSGITGQQSYNLTNGACTKTGLTSTNTYTVSYWSSTGTSYSVTGSTSVKQGKTINGWTYFEHQVSGTGTVTVSGSGNIDELRLYPTGALVTTYTYTPLVGMTSQCDAGNRVTYYEYDSFGRLKDIKDQDGNIIKTYNYHYFGQ